MTLPKSWSGGTPSGGPASKVTVWLGYVDTKHEAGKLIQWTMNGTLRAAEAWTDGRRAEDDKHVELDYELAVALANATGLEDHSDGAKSRVRGMASIGRRLCAQVVERAGDSAAAHTRDTHGVQGRERAVGKAHSVVTECG